MIGQASEPRTMRMELSDNIKQAAVLYSRYPKSKPIRVKKRMHNTGMLQSDVLTGYEQKICLLPNQLSDAFGCHQLKDVRSGEAEEVAFGGQLERAHGDAVLYPAAKIPF